MWCAIVHREAFLSSCTDCQGMDVCDGQFAENIFLSFEYKHHF